MVFLYDFGLLLYTLFVRIASIKNKKAKKWLDGRKNLFDHITNSVNLGQKCTWFHFASLGEFEQGRPVLEHLKKLRPESPLIITFFSPSGYEIRKDYPIAAHVFYLPLDTSRNAEHFIRLINPQVAVFTKYEYWYHYFKILKRNDIPLFMISTIFRRNQVFFKWYGNLHRDILNCVTHFFVQNEKSRSLLGEIGFNNATVSGDTRFDRVYEHAQAARRLDLVEAFAAGYRVVIGGSTWPQDEDLLARLALDFPNVKFIVAPHEIQQAKIEGIEQAFPSTVRYSELTQVTKEQVAAKAANEQVLIIDNIGMLSSLYQYGQVAYIGGGFGAGIHNTLEAAAFGLPVIFGPKYQKFQEAKDLLSAGGGFAISSYSELKATYEDLQAGKNMERAGDAARSYVSRNTGATKIILEKLLASLS